LERARQKDGHMTASQEKQSESKQKSVPTPSTEKKTDKHGPAKAAPATRQSGVTKPQGHDIENPS
jgi:hypothetical protein